MEAIDRNFVVGAAVGAFGIYALAVGIYRHFFGPLKDIPGPWYTKVSDFWLSANALAFRQCRAVDNIFHSYGPVVCLGPNKVGFIDANVAKTVYAKFPKDAFYLSLRMSGNDHAMTTLNPVEHILRRRGFAAHYSFDNIACFQTDMHDFTLQLLARLLELAGSQAVDCTIMFRHLLVDVIGVSGYDFKVGGVAKWCAGQTESLTTMINDWPKRALMEDLLPRWLWALLGITTVPRLRQFMSSHDLLCNFTASRVNGVRAAIADGKLDQQDKRTLVARMLQYRMPNGKVYSDEDLCAEVMAHTIAGTDTTSTSLSYAMWSLAMHVPIMHKLQAELDDVMEDPQRIPDMHILMGLPYLNAVIKEVLRLYGSAPAPLPRIVPESAAPLDIQGYKVPAGTVVLTQSWTTHRQERVFADAMAFRPERWLEETEDMKNNWIPFGTGSRVCGGQNMAMTMMRIAIATLLRNFDVECPPQTTATTMYTLEAFAAFPLAMQCDIRFVPRAH